MAEDMEGSAMATLADAALASAPVAQDGRGESPAHSGPGPRSQSAEGHATIMATAAGDEMVGLPEHCPDDPVEGKSMDPDLFRCGLCAFTAGTVAAVSHHKHEAHPDGEGSGYYPIFACADCEYTSLFRSSWANHRRRHTGEKPYGCTFEGCSYRSRATAGLRQHMRKHSEERFKCEQAGCNYEAKDKKSVENHQKRHKGEAIDRPHQCPFCSYRTCYPQQLKIHERRHTMPPIACDHPGCSFQTTISQAALEYHKKRRHEEKPLLKCNLCIGYTTKHQGYLDRHIKRHQQEGTPSPYSLAPVATMAIHADLPLAPPRPPGVEYVPRKYKRPPAPVPKDPHALSCSYTGCAFAARREDAMAAHRRTHTGERPFPCPEPGCSYRGTQKGAVKSHMRSHTGEKPYACELCGAAFAHAHLLKAHAKKHEQNTTTVPLTIPVLLPPPVLDSQARQTWGADGARPMDSRVQTTPETERLQPEERDSQGHGVPRDTAPPSHLTHFPGRAQ